MMNLKYYHLFPKHPTNRVANPFSQYQKKNKNHSNNNLYIILLLFYNLSIHDETKTNHQNLTRHFVHIPLKN